MKMRILASKFILFGIVMAAAYYFAQWQLVQGQVDYFYPKFTHQASSMIIGISRANDGITPSIIERNFGNQEISYPVLNFAFAHQISDYGPAYLDAIQKKLDPSTREGLFILEVNPASLSIRVHESDVSSEIEDDQSFITTIKRFNRHPNFEYVRKMYNHPLYKGFKKSRRIDMIRYTHDDGWQEVTKQFESYVVSEEEVRHWKDLKLEEFTTKIKHFKPSVARLEYLERTIDYLNDKGQVFLVRIPISSELLQIEKRYWQDFNSQIGELASRHQIHYFDYSGDGENYDTYDGSHLFASSARKFTQRLCNDIKSARKLAGE